MFELGKRKPRSYDNTRKSLLRLKGKYICPICSAENSQNVHTIRSKQSFNCLIEEFRNLNRKYGVDIDANYRESHYEIIVTKALYFINLIPYDIQYFFGNSEWQKVIKEKTPDIYEEYQFILRMIELSSVFQLDYWKHPAPYVEEVHRKKQNIIDEKQQKAVAFIKEFQKHRIPEGIFWKTQKDTILSNDPELDVLKKSFPGYEINYYISPFFSEFENGYVIRALGLNSKGKSTLYVPGHIIKFNEIETSIEKAKIKKKYNL